MRTLLFLLLLLFAPVLNAQDDTNDSLGLPGDNFDLPGALELFKTAQSLDAFEEALNKENNQVNNLDLNEDGNVDYIQVIDNMSNDTHAVILRVAVSETENQDVAVIGIEKTANNTAVLQIVGDDELYGDNYIVEPADEQVEKSGKGPAVFDPLYAAPAPIVIINVWYWPCVRYVYAPGYRVWRSPYRWHYYPVWWSPWRPVAWRVHHGRVVRYHHVYCRRVTVYRVYHARRVYAPHRTAAPSVQRRTAVQRQQHAQRQQVRQQETQRTNQPANNRPANNTNKQQPARTQQPKAGKAQPKATKAPRSKTVKSSKPAGSKPQSRPASRPR